MVDQLATILASLRGQMSTILPPYLQALDLKFLGKHRVEFQGGADTRPRLPVVFDLQQGILFAEIAEDFEGRLEYLPARYPHLLFAELFILKLLDPAILFILFVEP